MVQFSVVYWCAYLWCTGVPLCVLLCGALLVCLSVMNWCASLWCTGVSAIFRFLLKFVIFSITRLFLGVKNCLWMVHLVLLCKILTAPTNYEYNVFHSILLVHFYSFKIFLKNIHCGQNAHQCRLSNCPTCACNQNILFFQIALDQILFKSCALLQSFAFDAIQSGGVKPQNHRLCKMLTKFKNNRNRRFLLKTIYIIDLSW